MEQQVIRCRQRSDQALLDSRWDHAALLEEWAVLAEHRAEVLRLEVDAPPFRPDSTERQSRLIPQ
jgi:hypothetical protein